MLDQLFIDQPLDVGPIQVWPIAGRLGHTRYNVPGLTGDVHARELEAPDVRHIEICNGGWLPLVMPAGWLVEGLRQSRMVVDDVLIPAGARAVVDVVCVEAGRWDDARESRSAGRAPLGVMLGSQTQSGEPETGRNRQDARQLRIWTAVRSYESRTGRRPTSSLTQILREDTRRSRSMASLIGMIDSLDFPNGATGYVVAIGSLPVLIELWSRPEPANHMLRSLLRGLLLDLPDGEIGPPPRRGVIEAFIDQVRVATEPELLSFGSGGRITLGHARLLGMGLRTEAGEFLHMTAMSREFYDLAA